MPFQLQHCDVRKDDFLPDLSHKRVSELALPALIYEDLPDVLKLASWGSASRAWLRQVVELLH